MLFQGNNPIRVVSVDSIAFNGTTKSEGSSDVGMTLGVSSINIPVVA
jgi:hypothetical protein